MRQEVKDPTRDVEESERPCALAALRTSDMAGALQGGSLLVQL